MQFSRIVSIILTSLLCTLWPIITMGHHSYAAFFDMENLTELEGEVTSVKWYNPHVSFGLKVISSSGEEQLWEVETLAQSGLRRRDISEPFVAIGDQVKVYGNLARKGTNNLYLSNILLSNGVEVTMRGNVPPNWSDEIFGKTGAEYALVGDGSSPELGFFRVWSTSAVSPFPFNEDRFPELTPLLPLTASVRAVQANFDPITDNVIADCTLKGMPVIMEQPYPMEIVEIGGNMVLRMEEYNTVRTIFMGDNANPDSAQPSLLGYTVGHWENENTLVATTTKMGWGWFNTVGVPITENAVSVETFTLSEDGSRLDYEMLVTDETIFTEPVPREKYFLYIPDVEVQDFSCTVNDLSAR
jgi:hypothetical protein